jgi:hypothetical protein
MRFNGGGVDYNPQSTVTIRASTDMQIRYRRGTPQDIYSAIDVLGRDRSLFSRQVWNLLPSALANLIERNRIFIGLCEEVDTGHIVFVGGSGFLHERFLNSALEGEGALLEPAVVAELEGRPAFQNYKQVAAANRRDDLRLLSFFGSPPPVDFGDSNTFANLAQMTEAWNFFHKGFSIREIWCDTSNQLLSELHLRVGLRMHRRRPLPDGGIALPGRMPLPLLHPGPLRRCSAPSASRFHESGAEIAGTGASR